MVCRARVAPGDAMQHRSRSDGVRQRQSTWRPALTPEHPSGCGRDRSGEDLSSSRHTSAERHGRGWRRRARRPIQLTLRTNISSLGILMLICPLATPTYLSEGFCPRSMSIAKRTILYVCVLSGVHNRCALLNSTLAHVPRPDRRRALGLTFDGTRCQANSLG